MNAKHRHYILGESSTLRLCDSSNFNMLYIVRDFCKNKQSTKCLAQTECYE